VQKECRSQDVVRRMSCLAGAVFGSGRSRFGLVVLKCDLFRLIVIASIRMQERASAGAGYLAMRRTAQEYLSFGTGNQLGFGHLQTRNPTD